MGLYYSLLPHTVRNFKEQERFYGNKTKFLTLNKVLNISMNDAIRYA